MKEQKTTYFSIIISIIVVALLGTLFVNLGMEWYDTLARPSQFVPNFIIPIVWTIIYIIFAVVLCLLASVTVFSTKTKVLLIINGILNILWCLVFFTFGQTFGGLIFIVLLLISAFLLVNDLIEYGKWYTYLTAIYPIWVSIATGLNLSLWILN